MPRPIRLTCKPVRPRCAYCIAPSSFFFTLMAPASVLPMCYRGYHRSNIRCAVSLILRLVGSVYLVIERLIIADIHKCHIASDNTSLGPQLNMAEPDGGASTPGPHVQLITDA